MSVRLGIFAVAALVLGAALGVGVVDLPAGSSADGPYAQALTERSLGQHALNVVAGVLFDLRSLDTLGESLALFAAAAGLQLALRELPGEHEQGAPRRAAEDREVPSTSDAVRTVSFALVPPLTALAAVVTLRGHLDVGGGLQGGGLAVAALAMVFLGGHYRSQQRLAPDRHLDAEEAVGVGGYALLGLVGLLVGGALLENVLPSGVPGQLLSGGTIGLLGLLVAIEARAALAVILNEVQEEPFEREGSA
jgi:multicomponent Na+:H+ antiporter subunit B